MDQYLSLVKEVLENGEERTDRTGTGTLSLFGVQRKYDLQDGFPLVTTKKVYMRAIIHELLWFLSGSTNIKYLVDNNVKIWNEWAYQGYLEANNLLEKYPRYSQEWTDHMKEFVENIKNDNAFAEKYGDLGPVYGKQWRRWEGADGKKIDQIAEVINLIKNKPDSRRMIVSGWNVADIDELIKNQNGAPPLCHTLFQFYVQNGKLSCQLYQRSADIALGVPFNIATYSMLLMIIAQECNLEPGVFVHTMGDAHIYSNHVEGLQQQLKETPRKLPQLKIAKKPIMELTFDDFELIGYEHGPRIHFPIAV